MGSGGAMEDIGQELQQRQQELLLLQRQQQELQERARQLTELNTRRNELIHGQREIRERLLRAIVILEAQSRKEVEQMHETRQTFSEQLAEISAIEPSEWSPSSIEEELARALAKVDQAQAVYTQSRAKLDALRGRDLEPAEGGDESSGSGSTSSGSDSFTDNFLRGLAFNLPLIVAIFLGLILFQILK
jgi:hypothetical protein